MNLNKKEIKEVIDYINFSYDENVPGPVKFIVRRKVKKIQGFDLDSLPEQLRKCTVEELLLLLKEAYEKKKLNL